MNYRQPVLDRGSVRGVEVLDLHRNLRVDRRGLILGQQADLMIALSTGQGHGDTLAYTALAHP